MVLILVTEVEDDFLSKKIMNKIRLGNFLKVKRQSQRIYL